MDIDVIVNIVVGGMISGTGSTVHFFYDTLRFGKDFSGRKFALELLTGVFVGVLLRTVFGDSTTLTALPMYLLSGYFSLPILAVIDKRGHAFINVIMKKLPFGGGSLDDNASNDSKNVGDAPRDDDTKSPP